MWKKEIHKLLEINQIDFEIIQNQSVFCLVYIPQKQLYLHLIELQIFQNNALPNNYFQDFSDKINAQNQKIIHLWEDVCLSKTDLVKSRILTMLGSFTRLHARHCFIERIDKPTADNFLKINHLQDSVKAKFKYGLFLKPQYVERFIGGVICTDTNNGIDNSSQIQQFNNSTPQKLLIAVATFSGGRTMKIGERAGTRSFELIRFATLQNYVVVGGMDKLLKAFIKEHQPDDIMSYADRDWSDGRSYDKLGFTKIENTSPQPFYLNLKTLERSTINLPTQNERPKIFNTGSIKYIKQITHFSSLIIPS